MTYKEDIIEGRDDAQGGCYKRTYDGKGGRYEREGNYRRTLIYRREG